MPNLRRIWRHFLVGHEPSGGWERRVSGATRAARLTRTAATLECRGVLAQTCRLTEVATAVELGIRTDLRIVLASERTGPFRAALDGKCVAGFLA